jgi:3-phosphoshikimate 1-carboxyvinyltransferase
LGNLSIEPSKLEGSLFIPSSKSHTLRAILFATLAHGKSTIHHFLPSPDAAAMIEATRLLGASVTVEGDRLLIEGVGGKPKVPDDVIQCGNSGQVLRFIGALAGLLPGFTILTGDASIRHKRPIFPLLSALKQLGAQAHSSRGDGHAPILIKGPLIRGTAELDGRDSQPVSGLLIAGAFAPHPIELRVKNPGEKPWVRLTLNWLERVGIPYTAKDYIYYRTEGNAKIDGFTYSVPGDFSTAAFPIVAALITQSDLTLHNIDMDDVQGDKAIIPLLQKMGAQIIVDAKKKSLKIEKGSQLKGMRIDVNDFIDALPILAVVGCFAEGRTELFNAAVAREKESDRIASMATELKKMGAHIEEKADGLVIYSSKLYGTRLNSYQDHRIALSLSVAAMAARGESVIENIECIDKTFPSFYADFLKVGAKFEKWA